MIYVTRGDLEWMTKHFSLPNVSSHRPCGLCKCSNEEHTTVPWTDVNYPPVWAAHLVTDEVANGNLGGKGPVKMHFRTKTGPGSKRGIPGI